jgi:hypothetical protein
MIIFNYLNIFLVKKNKKRINIKRYLIKNKMILKDSLFYVTIIIIIPEGLIIYVIIVYKY